MGFKCRKRQIVKLAKRPKLFKKKQLYVVNPHLNTDCNKVLQFVKLCLSVE